MIRAFVDGYRSKITSGRRSENNVWRSTMLLRGFKISDGNSYPQTVRIPEPESVPTYHISAGLFWQQCIAINQFIVH